jgi:hypothetical protein
LRIICAGVKAVLKERYARGEIDEAEVDVRKRGVGWPDRTTEIQTPTPLPPRGFWRARHIPKLEDAQTIPPRDTVRAGTTASLHRTPG